MRAAPFLIPILSFVDCSARHYRAFSGNCLALDSVLLHSPVVHIGCTFLLNIIFLVTACFTLARRMLLYVDSIAGVFAPRDMLSASIFLVTTSTFWAPTGVVVSKMSNYDACIRCL